ncbi:hypothetical protein CEXT_238861 [Caerostris extrusa]|uniref:CCR4-NOT transcription complex subunit 4 n=1 Tax=Caerostris extrusa TaxID=172846 RepID=A0AAV4R4X5_CAEEX|nr:hypothetical protein CEXT_238861 [Caerostris extrusa]
MAHIINNGKHNTQFYFELIRARDKGLYLTRLRDGALKYRMRIKIRWAKILQDKDCNSKKQSKKQKKMANNREERKTCPLCLEPFDPDDANFFPCKCGYQVCRFCWHRIRTNENCLCPACRRQYPEDPVTFKPLSQEELMKMKNEKKMKEIKKRKEIAESRKQLANIRVVQKNLIYVSGLPAGLETDEEKSRRISQVFKEFGTVQKCVFSSKTNYAGSHSPKSSAYVTYYKVEDALKALKKIPTIKIEGNEIKTSLGTTKYCSNFLKNVHCPKADCMYLHELADEELSFTQDQIAAGQHLTCGNMLYERMIAQMKQKAVQISPPKESCPEKQEIEIEKPSIEKIIVKEEPTECIEESILHPPAMQSRLQTVYINSEKMSVSESSGSESHANCQVNCHSPPADIPQNISMVQQSAMLPAKSLPSENPNPSVNTSSVSSPHSVQNSVDIVKLFCGGQKWPEDASECTQTITSNSTRPTELLSNDTDINCTANTNFGTYLPFGTNGSTNLLSKALECKLEPALEDDGLGFDPCQLSLDGLKDLLAAETKLNPISYIRRAPGMQKPVVMPSPLMQMKNTVATQQMQMQRLRNSAPPGFIQSHQQQPVYDASRNTQSNRITPIVNMQNYNAAIRPNFQIQRFQAPSNNPVANGYTTPVRAVSLNLSEGCVNVQIPFQQAPAVLDMLTRSTMPVQHMPSQRIENMPILPQQQQQQQQPPQQQQFPIQEQNLSPSYWNMNQTQWINPQENFQNLSKYRAANPQLANSFALVQQRRAEQMQQITARVGNMSPFPDNNTQYGLPNSSSPLTKGVHTFP